MKLAVLVKVLQYAGMCYQQQDCSRIFLELNVLIIWGLRSSDAASSVSRPIIICINYKMLLWLIPLKTTLGIYVFIQMNRDKICSCIRSPWKKVTIIVMLVFSLERHLQSRSNLRQLIRLVKMKSKLFNGNMKRDSPYLWLLSGKKNLLLVSLIVDRPRKLTKYLLEITFLVDKNSCTSYKMHVGKTQLHKQDYYLCQCNPFHVLL